VKFANWDAIDFHKSLVIHRIEHEPAVGYWTSITTGESQTFEYKVGITSSTSETVTRETGFELTASMTAGVQFGDVTVGGTYKDTTTREVSSQFGVSLE